jgi:hypothetical protein
MSDNKRLKIIAEKKTTKAATKTATASKATKKAATPKAAEIAINAENVGFKAGDVYQALAKSDKALSIAEIAKAAKITPEETYLGLGWLLKEGKVTSVDG